MSRAEIDRRIEILSNDFEIITVEIESEAAYKLGASKGYAGQADHFRHEFYRANLSRIS